MRTNKLETKLIRSTCLVLLSSLWYSCGDSKKEQAEKLEQESEKVVSVPDFDQDSAYSYIMKQVEYGPRVPGSTAHAEAADYLVNKLTSFGAQVQLQEFEVTTFDNQTVPLKNIIASFYPDNKKRILLASHWDSRPFADKDSVRQYEPIDGANDGASGVGVLLEIGRALGTGSKKPEVGVDIILFDGEDWGNDTKTQDEVPLRDNWESWWCLGSQYWAKNKHKPGYSAYYGILLDMVGAKDSQFRMEGGSMQYAPSIVRKVWNRAAAIGYSSYFSTQKEHGILDDHIFLNKNANIPTIDIVHYDPEHGYFGDYHHTHRDNIDIISKEMLEAVGETVLNVVYYE